MEMKTGWKVAAAVAAVVVIVAAIAVLASGGDDGPDVRYDYEMEIVGSFTEADGDVQDAPAGREFLVVTWTVANDSYADGFSTNDIIFQTRAVVDGVGHGTSVYGYLHPGYVLGDIVEGETASFVLVYEVPAGTTAEDVTMQVEYVMFDPPSMERDASLRG